MAIGKKASTRKKESLNASVNVEDLINKGGSVAGNEVAVDEESTHRITVRFPSQLVKDIDAVIKEMPVAIRPNRNQWIVEAAYQRLKDSE